MDVEINVREFLRNIESYARDSKYDYTYYLLLQEMKRMRIFENIGNLKPEHMSPIFLFLRDWMLGGWVIWFEKRNRYRRMYSELCKSLNYLKNEFISLHYVDLENFEPDNHGDVIKTIYNRIYDLKLAASKEAMGTVTSKILHLLKQNLFVMWDTGIINYYKLKSDAEDYIRFLVKMKELAQKLNPHSKKIKEKSSELRSQSCEIYGTKICSEKSLAKLIDEYNWIKTRRRKKFNK